MIKSIYKNRIKMLKREYNKLSLYIKKREKTLNGYIEIINDVLKEIEIITNDNKIEPNIKYIEIDKKSKYIETVSIKISNIQKEIENKFNELDKEKDIIIDNCLDENQSYSKEEVLMEIDKLFNEKT